MAVLKEVKRVLALRCGALGDLVYASAVIDTTKIETELGWRAEETFDTGIVKTINWYLGKYS